MLDWKLLAGAAGIVAAVVFVIWLIFFCCTPDTGAFKWDVSWMQWRDTISNISVRTFWKTMVLKV